MTDKTTTLEENGEFRADIAKLMMKYITSPEDMTDELPAILLSMIAMTAGVMQSTGWTQEQAFEFYSTVFQQAWEFEEERITAIRSMVEGMSKE